MVVQPGALWEISVINFSFLEVGLSAVRSHQSKLQSTVYSTNSICYPWRATTMEGSTAIQRLAVNLKTSVYSWSIVLSAWQKEWGIFACVTSRAELRWCCAVWVIFCFWTLVFGTAFVAVRPRWVNSVLLWLPATYYSFGWANAHMLKGKAQTHMHTHRETFAQKPFRRNFLNCELTVNYWHFILDKQDVTC